MIGWIRRLRLPARLRRWIDTALAIFHGWSWPYWKSLFGRLFLPRPKPDRGVKLELEALSKRESPTYLLSNTATVFGAAVVPTAQSSSQTPDVEKHAAVADTARPLPTAEEQERADLIFSETTTPDGSFSVDSYRVLDTADQLPSVDDAKPEHTANDPSFDPVMAADNALVDPASHPDAGPADGDKSGSNHMGAPAGNGVNSNPPNLAGAYAGAGQGPAGPSTPSAAGGGGGGGWGAGPGVINANQFMTANLNMAGSPTTNTPIVAAVSHTAIAAPMPSVHATTSVTAAPTAVTVMPTTAGSGPNNAGVHLPQDGSPQQSEHIYATPGDYTWTCPAGVTQVTVQLWGAGGGGAGGATSATSTTSGASSRLSLGGGGGGGGSYVVTGCVVVPGTVYDVQVGAGGAGGVPGSYPDEGGYGGSSIFNHGQGNNPGTLAPTAPGGLGGGYAGPSNPWGGPNIGAYGGSGPGYLGGDGGDGAVVSGPNAGGGGGGGAASDYSASGHGGAGSGTTGGAGGVGGSANVEAGNGGEGGGEATLYLPGDGQSPGGGGGGGGVVGWIGQAGGNGGNGEVIISWTNPLHWQGPTFSWTQTPAANPTATAPAAQTNTEGDNVSLQVQASDPNGNPLSYDAVDLPPGLSINSTTGLISGTVQNGAAEDFDGSYNPTIIVANNQGGSTTTTFSWTINQAQVAPVLSSPGNQSNLTGDNVSLAINATQVDNDPITYDASNLPTGLSIDPDSGLISGTVDPSAATGTPYAVTVTATDGATNLSTSQTFNWTITTSTAAPLWTAPGAQSNAVGDAVDLQLSAADANGDALTYTATGLPPGLTLDPIAGTITGTLPNNAASSTPYTVTVTASNGISSSSQTFAWTVNPISLSNPGDQGNLYGDSVSLQMSATDSSNGTLSYSATGLPPGLSMSSSGLISGNISNMADTNSPYSVTVTATDGPNTTSQTFNWTVAALALNPVNDQENQEGTAVSLQLSATDNMGTPTYSASGLPLGVSINSTTGLISGTVSLGTFGSSPYQVTVTAADGGNTSSQSFVWTVTPRVALTNPGPQSNATGDSVSLQVSATSPGGTMSYSASGLPDGVNINSSTGLISGTPTTASSTPYTVTVTANDGTSRSSQTFSWTVSALNLVSPGDQTNNDGDTVSLSLTTGYHGTGTLSYSANNSLPPGLSINTRTGQITGTIAETADTNSPYAVTVTVTDGTNTSSQTFNWTVNPVVSLDSIDDQSNADGDSVSLPVSASDALNNTLTYSATGLPPGLTIASTTGLISGTINAGADSDNPYAVTVRATDSAGLSVTQTFNWNVAAVGLINPGPQSSVDGQVVSLPLQGSSGATYSSNVLPPGLSISSTGLISGTLAPNADTNSPYVVTVTITLGSNSTNQTFLWTVTPVGLTAPSDQTNSEGDVVSLQLQGLSNGGSLTYSASGLPNGLSLNPTTGLITGTITSGAAANGPFTVDVAVTNGTVSASQSFTWTVNPVVNLTAPDNQSNNEGDSVSIQVTASDSNNASLTYTADGLPPGLSIDSGTGLITGTIAAGASSGGPYAVMVTASDSTYSASQVFDWSVTTTDTATPTLTNPGPQTNVAGDGVSLQIGASDPDGDALTYSADGLPEGLSIDLVAGLISGTITDDAVSTTPYSVTVSASDPNGQTVSQTFNWFVNDPALTVQAAPINAVEGNDTGTIALATFTSADLNAQADDFTATVDWGDGNSDTAVVSGGNGSFTVTGEHNYVETSSYVVQVTITDDTGANTTVTGTATVADAPLTLTSGVQVGAVQGQSANLVLASLSDGDPNAPMSDYTVTIDWGDGSGMTAGILGLNADGTYTISGAHAYSQDGTYTATVTVTDTDGATASTTSTVVVGDVYAGIAANLTVASFTDANLNVPASNFTATIDWGDGNQSAGTVTGGNGTFTVQGTHTYAQDSIDQSGGVYTVMVTVTDASGDTLTANSTVTVVRPPLSLEVNSQGGPSSGVVSDATMALFTEPDVADGVGEFSATIDWGDGSGTSAGTIEEVTPGLFAVVGSHTYALAGPYSVQVSLVQNWGYGRVVERADGFYWVPLGKSESSANYPTANDDYFPLAMQGAAKGTATGNVLANDTDPLHPRSTADLRVVAFTEPKYGTLDWEDYGNWDLAKLTVCPSPQAYVALR